MSIHPQSRGRLIAAICVVSLGLAACSGSTATAQDGTGGGQPAAGTSPAPGGSVPLAGAATGHVGATLTWASGGGNTVDVTLVKITDPATASDAPPAGDRWVGVEMTILDHAGDASSFDSVRADGRGSDGARYGVAGAPDAGYHVGSFTGCTPSSGYTPGQPETFCAGFAVPTGVTVASVGYSVVGVDIGAPDDLVWTLP